MAVINSYTDITALAPVDELILWDVSAGQVVNATVQTLGDWVATTYGFDRTGDGVQALFGIKADAGQAASIGFYENAVLRTTAGHSTALGKAVWLVYDSGGANAQYAWRATHSGAFEAYYSNSLRVATTANGATVTGVLSTTYSRVAATTGGATTPGDAVESLVLDPAATIATYSVTMPSAPQDGQLFVLACGASGGVTTLTHAPNAGQTLNGGLTTLAANGCGRWMYRTANTTWYRVG